MAMSFGARSAVDSPFFQSRPLAIERLPKRDDETGPLAIDPPLALSRGPHEIPAFPKCNSDILWRSFSGRFSACSPQSS